MNNILNNNEEDLSLDNVDGAGDIIPLNEEMDNIYAKMVQDLLEKRN